MQFGGEGRGRFGINSILGKLLIWENFWNMDEFGNTLLCAFIYFFSLRFGTLPRE
jgi:hypothetical protein